MKNVLGWRFLRIHCVHKFDFIFTDTTRMIFNSKYTCKLYSVECTAQHSTAHHTPNTENSIVHKSKWNKYKEKACIKPTIWKQQYNFELNRKTRVKQQRIIFQIQSHRRRIELYWMTKSEWMSETKTYQIFTLKCSPFHKRIVGW